MRKESYDKMKRLIYIVLGLFVLSAACHQIRFDEVNNSKDTLNITDAFNNQNVLTKNDLRESWCRWQNDSTQGNPYITNFFLDESLDDISWAIEQDGYNMMLFANRKGILTFDGEEWHTIETPGFPYSINKDPKRGIIFIGCSEDFGYLIKNRLGNYNYRSLSGDIETVGDITDIRITDKFVYFYSNETLTRISIDRLTEKRHWKTAPDDLYQGIVQVNDNIYLNINGYGLFYQSNDQNSPVPPTFDTTNFSSPDTAIAAQVDIRAIANEKIVFSTPFSDSLVIIGTDNSNLYLYNGFMLFDYKIEADEFLNESVLSGGIELSDSEFALSTLTDGCLVIKKQTGKTISSINYQTGLPDDEILAIGKDNNKGLWLSHGFGVSRVNYSVPINNFDTHLGLKGNLIALADFDSTIYVTSTEGVFYLSQVRDYKEIEVLVKEKQKQKQRKKEEFSDVNDELPKKETEKKTKNETKKDVSEDKNETETKEDDKEDEGVVSGLLDRWRKFRKKKKGDDEKDEKEKIREEAAKIDEQIEEQKKKETDETADTLKNQPVDDIEEQRTQKRTETRYVAEKVMALQSINYVFRKIDGIDEKGKHIVKYKDRLLVTTNTGVYEIKDKQVSSIVTGKYVTCIASSRIDGRFYVGTNHDFFIIENEEDDWLITYLPVADKINEYIYSISEDSDTTLWLGGENIAYHITDGFKKISPYHFENKYSERIMIRMYHGIPHFFLNSGIFRYNSQQDSIVPNNTICTSLKGNTKYLFSQENITWITDHVNWCSISDTVSYNKFEKNYFNLFDDIQFIYVDNEKNIWIINGKKQLYKIPFVQEYFTHDFNVFIEQISDGADSLLRLNNAILDYKHNAVQFDMSAPFFLTKNAIYYRHWLEGLNDYWTEWNNESTISYPYLPSGKYTLHVKSRNVLGDVSREIAFDFVVRTPFWETWWFISAMFILAVAGIYAIILFREKKLQKAKNILEEKVKERTAELQKQKEQITDSIQYASRIQAAIMPPEEYISNILPEHFILYKPRDIVSGDFYWMTQKGDKVILAAADCTGHGVPGAFLSMLGITFLSEIVNKRQILEPDKILIEMRKYVIASLHQQRQKSTTQDGMDMALVVWDKKTYAIEFSGAYNPLYIVRKPDKPDKNGDAFELIDIKANRMPIGIYRKHSDFKSQQIQGQKGDTLYIFSDGYVDQFGGPKGRKFLSKRFKRKLLAIQEKPMSEQCEILNRTIEDWMKDNNQVDDILVFGIRI